MTLTHINAVLGFIKYRISGRKVADREKAEREENDSEMTTKE